MTLAPLGAAVYIAGVLTGAALVGAAASRWAQANPLDRALVGITTGMATALGAALLLGVVSLSSGTLYIAVMMAAGTIAAAILLSRPALPPRVPAAWSFSGITALLIGTGLVAVAFVPVVRELPSRHEVAVANLMTYSVTILSGFLAVIACAVITRELGGRADHATLAALAVMSAPVVLGTQAHSLANELAATAGLAAGLASLLRGQRDCDPRWVAAGGIALGFALGTAHTMLLVPLVLVGAVAWLRPRRHVIWLLPGIVVFGAVLLPEAQGALVALESTILEHVVGGRWSIVARWTQYNAELWGPTALVVVAAMIGAALWKPGRADKLVVAGLVIAAAAVYATTPSQGAGPQGLDLLVVSNIRNAMPAVLLGVALASALLPSRALLSITGVAFAYNVWRLVQGYGWRSDLGISVQWAVITALVAVSISAAVGYIGRRRLPLHVRAIHARRRSRRIPDGHSARHGPVLNDRTHTGVGEPGD